MFLLNKERKPEWRGSLSLASAYSGFSLMRYAQHQLTSVHPCGLNKEFLQGEQW